MRTFSTRQVAKQLGITHVTLIRYITEKKIPTPKSVTSGGMTIHLWTPEEIEHVRKLLPKIANGRKTRHKKQLALSSQQSVKAGAPARVPVPHRKSKSKKKK